MFKPQSFTNTMSQASVKHRVPRLRILLSFLQDFQSYEGQGRITKDSFPLYNPVLPVLKESVQAQSPEQRSVAQQCLVEVYRIYGFTHIE